MFGIVKYCDRLKRNSNRYFCETNWTWRCRGRKNWAEILETPHRRSLLLSYAHLTDWGTLSGNHRPSSVNYQIGVQAKNLPNLFLSRTDSTWSDCNYELLQWSERAFRKRKIKKHLDPLMLMFLFMLFAWLQSLAWRCFADFCSLSSSQCELTKGSLVEKRFKRAIRFDEARHEARSNRCKLNLFFWILAAKFSRRNSSRSGLLSFDNERPVFFACYFL